MTWEPGRQGSGYFKRKLFGWSWGDCYLLKYPEGSRVPPHRDPVPTGRHFRLNIELRKARDGGEFYGGAPIVNHGRVVLFRPDMHVHAVSPVYEGTRWVLSLGAVLP